jgi:peptidyl-tRNA hydrolase, PTH1 family
VSEELKKIIVGLGNPGPRYEFNRHNIGFMVVDELLRRFKLTLPVETSEYLATAEGFSQSDLVLIKPLTYMNLSGEALLRWADRAGEKLSGRPLVVPELSENDEETPPVPDPGIRPLIICDDLALPLGAVRLRAKGSSGGQNGIQSLIETLGGEHFPRLRVGISPRETTVDPEFWPDYVLSNFDNEELEAVREVVKHAADTVEYWLEHELDQTASRFNRKSPPQ